MFENPKWKALKKISAPRELGDSYIIDASSSGIYTPVLEGIANKNPKGKTLEGYLKEANKDFFLGRSMAKTNPKEAYGLMLRALLTVETASHVDFFSEARKISKKTSKSVLQKDKKLEADDFVKSVLKLNKSDLVHFKNKIYLELMTVAAKLSKKDIEEIGKDFSFSESKDKEGEEILADIKEVRPPRKKPVRKTPEKIKTVEQGMIEYMRRLRELKKLIVDLEIDIEADKKSRVERRSEFDRESIAERIEVAKSELAEWKKEFQETAKKFVMIKKELEKEEVPIEIEEFQLELEKI